MSMQQVLTYFNDFLQQVNKPLLVFSTAFVAILILLNYRLGIESRWIHGLPTRTQKFMAFYGVYLVAYGLPFLFYFLFDRVQKPSAVVVALLLLAPAIFALKATAGGWKPFIQEWVPGKNGRYLALVLDWPLRLVITVILLWIFHSWLGHNNGTTQGFTAAMGLADGKFNAGPYLLLLLAVVPLVVFAATQPAFLHTYPKLKSLDFLAPEGPTWLQQLGFELSYGTDFVTIELFFRGFLVVLACRFAGTAAILPMAVFYCSIHFGKPLLECISSYFGGIVLGIIACYAQTIWGGILIHLGLAWMMELAAGVALHLKK